MFTFVAFGSIANGLVLKIYWRTLRRHSQEASQLYIVALACVDLFGCVFGVSLIPLFEWGALPREIKGSLQVLHVEAHLIVQVAMTFDRLFAVFRPHQFTQLRRRTNAILAAIFVVVELILQASYVLDKHFDIRFGAGYFFLLILGFALFVMIVAYPAIAMRLYLHNQRRTAGRKVQPQAVATANINTAYAEFITEQAPVEATTTQTLATATTKQAPVKATTKPEPAEATPKQAPSEATTKKVLVSATIKQAPGAATTKQAPAAFSINEVPASATVNPNHNVSENRERTKYHLKTMKLYVAILALFVASFIPPMLRIALDFSDDTAWLGYIYHVNNIGHPVIYYVFNDSFRDKVNETLTSFYLLCRRP